ncbi:MAG: coiled-coil domain-containing protein [Eggerthellaceae bacterium]
MSSRLGKAVLSCVFSVALVISFTLPPLVPIAEATPSAEETLDKINDMQAKLDEASDNYNAALDEQKEAEKKRDEAQQKIDEANDKINQLQDELGSRARDLYRTGSASVIDLLLDSQSFSEFTKNWDLLTMLSEDDAEMVKQTKDLRAQVESDKKTYDEQAKKASDKAAEAKRIKDEAQQTVDELQATYDNMTAEEEAAVNEAEQTQAKKNAKTGIKDGGGVSNGSAVSRARSQIGKPYAWGAVGPSSYDCSGLVSYALTGRHERLGTTITFMSWQHVSNPQPGDICVNSHHCGIYIGGGQMIHAPHTGATVCVGPVSSDMEFVRY